MKAILSALLLLISTMAFADLTENGDITSDTSHVITRLYVNDIALTGQFLGKITIGDSGHSYFAMPGTGQYLEFDLGTAATTDTHLHFHPVSGTSPVIDFFSGSDTVAGVASSQVLSNKEFSDAVVADSGLQLKTVATQPACDSAHQGLTWNVQRPSVGPDQLQICQDTSGGGTYYWVTH